MVGLASHAERVHQFHESGVHYRRRLREAILKHDNPYREDAAHQLERDLDRLLMEAANLAREPLLVHMVKLTEAAAMFSQLTPRVYPDPKEGSKS